MMIWRIKCWQKHPTRFCWEAWKADGVGLLGIIVGLCILTHRAFRERITSLPFLKHFCGGCFQKHLNLHPPGLEIQSNRTFVTLQQHFSYVPIWDSSASWHPCRQYRSDEKYPDNFKAVFQKHFHMQVCAMVDESLKATVLKHQPAQPVYNVFSINMIQ